jgi:hypothetical protein
MRREDVCVRSAVVFSRIFLSMDRANLPNTAGISTADVVKDVFIPQKCNKNFMFS